MQFYLEFRRILIFSCRLRYYLSVQYDQKMKKFYLILLIVVACLQLQAKSMREMWLTMPDSIVPYLNKNLRLELVDYMGMKVKSEVKNLLRGITVMDTLTANYASLTINETLKMQLRLLPITKGDTILCMVKTFNGPLPESEIAFFTSRWYRLEYPSIDLQSFVSSLVVKPDTMSQHRFNELKNKIEAVMVEASLSDKDDELTIRPTVPLLARGEKKTVDTILMQRKLKWDGRTYN